MDNTSEKYLFCPSEYFKKYPKRWRNGVSEFFSAHCVPSAKYKIINNTLCSVYNIEDVKKAIKAYKSKKKANPKSRRWEIATQIENAISQIAT